MACSQPSEDCDPLPQADHRKGPRRRGEALFQAIYDATLAELVASGYAGMAMERVAARARTSKASLYRRWPSRAELVADAIRHCVADTRTLVSGAPNSLSRNSPLTSIGAAFSHGERSCVPETQ